MICPSCQAENDDAAEVCFSCRHVLSAISRGSVIASRYEILTTLGKGGMGTVYKAHDRVLDENVAIKLLRSEISRDTDMTRRFRSEIKLARKVSHKNVCRIHEYGEDGGLRYISMEYIEGIDLKQVVRQRGGLPAEEAFGVAIQLAQGLEAIHEVGIIHRDLKTPNIMRDARGLVRLMDFGIAKQAGPDATTGATATGQVVGTPEYMSPEQARGQKVDFRTDIYALGVVVFEIFTGQVPFKGETPVATLFMHVQDPPPLTGSRAERIPPALVPVLQKALAKEPPDRYTTAREMADALQQARGATPGGATVVPTPRSTPTVVAAEPLTSPPTTPLPTASPTVLGTASPTVGLPTQVEKETVIAAAPKGPPPARPRELAPTVVQSASRARVPRPAASHARPLWVLGVPALLLGAAALIAVRGGFLSTTSPAPPETMVPSPAAPVSAAPTPAPTEPAASAPSAEPSPEVRAALPTKPPEQRLPTPRPNPLRAAASPQHEPPGRIFPAPTAAPPTPAAATPAPTQTLAASATPAPPTPAPPTPTPAATSAPVVEERGVLHLVVVPFADVTIDDKTVGSVTSSKIPLAPGAHVIVLSHPDYQPLRRKVTIVAGETPKLVVDMAEEGIRKKK